MILSHYHWEVPSNPKAWYFVEKGSPNDRKYSIIKIFVGLYHAPSQWEVMINPIQCHSDHQCTSLDLYTPSCSKHSIPKTFYASISCSAWPAAPLDISLLLLPASFTSVDQNIPFFLPHYYQIMPLPPNPACSQRPLPGCCPHRPHHHHPYLSNATLCSFSHPPSLVVVLSTSKQWGVW